MDKNLVLAIALSIGIYALWFGFIEKRYIQPAPPAAVAAARQDAPSSEGGRSPLPQMAGRQDAPQALPAQGSAAKQAAPSADGGGTKPADRRKIESEAAPLAAHLSELRIHPLGAAVVSCRYRGPLGMVELVHDPAVGLFSTFPQLRFEPESGSRWAATRGDGVRVTKEFLPAQGGDLPRIRVVLRNTTQRPVEGGPWTISMGPGLDTVPSESEENPTVWRAIALFSGEKAVKSLKPGPVAGALQWAGIDNRYFLAVVMPDFSRFEAVEADSVSPPMVTLRAKSALLAPGAEQAWDIPYYFGAKGYTWLRRYKAGLEKSVDFGWFKDLGRPLVTLLDWLQQRTGNWGWSIVIMTFLIQTLLFPLTYKSMKSMGAMKRLQPEIARLQQKYAKEPQRLNSEMMELYKKGGANPLGGCLPLMLQMPVFIALFNALRNSWELHGAPWIFWVHDLSAKDPFYVLPVIMGAIMFLQNRMNPAATADPTQKTMMTWMPVIFTFMFLSSPAGLVLYWLTSSMLSAGIQLALKEHFEQAR